MKNIVLVLGAIALVLRVVFPPTSEILPDGFKQQCRGTAGYEHLCVTDTSVLVVHVLVIVLIAGVAYFLVPGAKDDGGTAGS